MTVRESINEIRAKVDRKVVNKKVIQPLILVAFGIYLSLLIIGHIIASIATNYTIWDNWISDLGGAKYTPAPYLYDIACIIAGALTIPLFFYMEKFLTPNLSNITRMRIRIAESAFIFGILGAISYIGVGIFSEDRNYFGLHGLCSELAFGGFAVNAFLTGWFVLLYDTKIPKLLGVYGVIGPMTMIIMFMIIGNALFEWLLLFAILLWVIPLAFFIF